MRARSVINQRPITKFSKEKLEELQRTRTDMTSCKLCGDICKWDLKYIPHRGYVCWWCFEKYINKL